MTFRRRIRLACAAVSLLCAAGGTLAEASPGVSQIVLHTEVEASYWTVDCFTPVGCGQAAPPSDPWPAHTLHVGDLGGTQTQSSYVLLDTGVLPADARVTATTLVLPVATDSEAGTINAASAAIEICRTTSDFADSDFDTAPPPSVNCIVKATATYHATPQPAFTADLAPLLTATNGSLADVGLAIVPATGTAGAWQVAFNGRDRNLAGQFPITAAVSFVETARTTQVAPVPAAPRPPRPAPLAPVAPPPAAAFRTPAGALSSQPAESPTIAPAPAGAATVPIASARLLRGGQYGMVWAVPLGLMLLGWLMFSTVRRDLRSAGWH